MNKVRMAGLAVVVVGVLAAVSLLFQTLNFYAGRSESTTDAQVATSSNGEGAALKQGQVSTLHLYVEGDGALEQGLREELGRQLTRSGRFADVVTLDHPSGVAANLLAVDVKSANQLWSGFYAQAEVKVVTSFSTMGGIYYPGQGPVRFSSGNAAAVAQGTYTMTDTTYGLFSVSGYQRALGRQLAGEVAKSLLAQFSQPVA